MSYAKQTWHDGPAGGTPLDAAALQHIEDGIEALEASLPDIYVTGQIVDSNDAPVAAKQLRVVLDANGDVDDLIVEAV